MESSQVSLTNFHGHVQEGYTNVMAGNKDTTSESYVFSGTHGDEEAAKAQEDQNRQNIHVRHDFGIDRN